MAMLFKFNKERLSKMPDKVWQNLVAVQGFGLKDFRLSKYRLQTWWRTFPSHHIRHLWRLLGTKKTSISTAVLWTWHFNIDSTVRREMGKLHLWKVFKAWQCGSIVMWSVLKYNRHLIAHLHKRDMGCVLWDPSVVYFYICHCQTWCNTVL